MVQWMNEDSNRRLVCHSSSEVRRLEHEHPHLVGRFMNIDNMDRGGWPGEMGIDNLDLVLNRLVGGRVALVSVTGEHDPEPMSQEQVDQSISRLVSITSQEIK